MNTKEYIPNAIRSENKDYSAISNRLTDQRLVRLLHCSIGLSTESGELLDAVKKNVFYGKDLDLVNLVEELGDILWYVAIACNELDVSLEQIMMKNINKLQIRYPDKYTDQKATDRDLDSEFKSLKS